MKQRVRCAHCGFWLVKTRGGVWVGQSSRMVTCGQRPLADHKPQPHEVGVIWTES